MRFSSLTVLSFVPISALVAACSANNPSSGFGNGDDGGGSTSDGGTSLDDGGDLGDARFGGGDGSSTVTCNPNPANFEVPGNNCDDDGDGMVDNPPAVCDGALAANGAAGDFAKALGLCQVTTATDPKWGVISATYSQGLNAAAPADGQHGILKQFGQVVRPREGASLGVLSSGFAREYDDATATTCTVVPGAFGFPDTPGAGCFKGGQQMTGRAQGAVPAGYPKPASGCQVDSTTFDVSAIKLQIKVPANAQGLSFDFDFWSGEWPDYVCTKFNDAFIAVLKSKAFNNGAADNVSFDAMMNPVSVNNGFFDRCTPNAQTGCMGGTTKTATCPGGTGELGGTGFAATGNWCLFGGGGATAGGGATGWLNTQAPVAPGEIIELDFIIWDTGDQNFDSTVLLDHFTWVPGPVQTGTQRPPK